MSAPHPAPADHPAGARGGAGRSDTWLLAFVAGGHVLLYAFGYSLLWPMRESGIPLFFRYGSAIAAGQLPYRDFAAEYPPLALGFFALPRLVTADFQQYATLLRALLLVCDLAIVGMLFAIARRERRSVAGVLLGYTVALLAIGPISSHQFDLLPAALTLLGLWLLLCGRDAGAGAALAAGALAKLYPLLLAPLALLWYLRQGAWGRLGRAIAGFAGVVTLTLVPWLAGGAASLQRLAGYHTQRPLQVESSYASVLLARAAVMHRSLATELSFGSANLAGPLSYSVAALSTWVMLAALALVYAIAWRRLRAGPLRADWVFPAALLVLLAGLLASKVLSPQYLIWILPLVPLAAAERRQAGVLLGLFVVSEALTYYVFPTHYQELVDGRPLAAGALLLRNLLLLAMAVVLARLAPQRHDHGWQLHAHDHQA